MFRTTLTAGALGAALSVGGLLAASTAATAAPITIGSQNFNDVNTASSTAVTFAGTGIPTDPVAWSSFTDDSGNVLILGLGTHGRFANPDVTTSAPNVYGAVAGFNDGTPGETDGPAPNGTTWNFNWFVEVIPATGSTAAIEDFGVKLLYDLAPGAGTDEVAHGVVDLSGALATTGFKVIQDSWNAAFGFLQPGGTIVPFLSPPGVGFDPFAAGEYTFALRSNLGNVGIAMNVAAVPLPAAGWLLLSAFAGLGLAARRRRRAA